MLVFMFSSLKLRWREVYPADRHGGIICPLCGNGSGSSGTGISEWKDGYLSCFKCGFRGDVIDLVQAENSVDFVTAVEILKSRLGVPSVVKSESGEFVGTPAEIYCKGRGLSAETCHGRFIKFFLLESEKFVRKIT